MDLRVLAQVRLVDSHRIWGSIPAAQMRCELITRTDKQEKQNYKIPIKNIYIYRITPHASPPCIEAHGLGCGTPMGLFT